MENPDQTVMTVPMVPLERRVPQVLLVLRVMLGRWEHKDHQVHPEQRELWV